MTETIHRDGAKAVQQQWRMPAEWEPHAGCLMAWPTRTELWGPVYDEAKREYAAVADAIAAFEPVIMVALPGQGADVTRHCTKDIEIVELPIDDSWLRDSGPIFVQGPGGVREGVDFAFNSWGERFLPYDKDAAISERLLAHLGVERRPSPMVLEGGAIAVDGDGTLITTLQCLLNLNRNPQMTQGDIETELRSRLGVTEIVWLPFGHYDDEHTDGHVDGVCAFVRPGVVIAQTCTDRGHPDYLRMAANRAVLDAKGFEVVDLPLYPYADVAGTTTMVSYLNFYIANGGVIVPIADHPMDAEALRIIERAFPDHEVVGVRSRVIAYGGGGVHCITQQIPRGAT